MSKKGQVNEVRGERKVAEKVYTTAYSKDVNLNERTLVAVANSGGIDRDLEIIDPMGWDLENFNKNPVFLFAHDYRKPSIGGIQWTKKSQEGLTFKVEFADTDLGNELLYLYANGFMRAFSVGFIPVKWEEADGKEGYYRKYTEAELLEISAVPVPCDPGAVVMNTAGGMKSMVKAYRDAVKDHELPALKEVLKKAGESIEDDEATEFETPHEDESSNDVKHFETWTEYEANKALEKATESLEEVLSSLRDHLEQHKVVDEGIVALTERVASNEKQIDAILGHITEIMKHNGMLKTGSTEEKKKGITRDDIKAIIRDELPGVMARSERMRKGRMY